MGDTVRINVTMDVPAEHVRLWQSRRDMGVVDECQRLVRSVEVVEPRRVTRLVLEYNGAQVIPTALGPVRVQLPTSEGSYSSNGWRVVSCETREEPA